MFPGFYFETSEKVNFFWKQIPAKSILDDCPCKYLDHVLFFFSDVTNAKNIQGKALGAIASVEKSKPKSGRLFGAICLKIVYSISRSSI